MRYKVNLGKEFDTSSLKNAVAETIKEYGADKINFKMGHNQDKDLILISDSSLQCTLCFLEYLLESSIILDAHHYIVQDGEPTKTLVEFIYKNERRADS